MELRNPAISSRHGGGSTRHRPGGTALQFLRHAVGLAVLVASASGCQDKPKFEYEPLRSEHLPGITLLNVPMIHQSVPRACGAAALEMVLRYYGKDVTQEAIMKQCDRGEVGGLAAKDLKALVEQQGMYAFIVHGNADDVYNYVDRKMPLIVARRAQFMRGLGNHYMVLVGRSADKEYVFLNDPEKGRIRVRLERFLSDWSAASSTFTWS